MIYTNIYREDRYGRIAMVRHGKSQGLELHEVCYIEYTCNLSQLIKYYNIDFLSTFFKFLTNTIHVIEGEK